LECGGDEMNCETARSHLIDFLGEEIGREEGGQLKEHLLGCASCRRELSALKSTCNTMKLGWPEEPIPQPISFKLEPRKVGPSWKIGWVNELPPFLRWPLTVTASLCVCLLALALTKTSFQFSQGQVALSFGGRTVISPGAMVSQNQPALSLEQVRLTMDHVMNQNQKIQEARWQQLLTQAGMDWNSKRQVDYETFAGRLKYLESTQNVVWKQTIQNESYVESLARDLYLRTGQARAGKP
jgi:hypothetical protein